MPGKTRKSKPSPPKLPTPVDAVKNADKRANIPTEKLHRLGRWAFFEIVDPWDA